MHFRNRTVIFERAVIMISICFYFDFYLFSESSCFEFIVRCFCESQTISLIYGNQRESCCVVD